MLCSQHKDDDVAVVDWQLTELCWKSLLAHLALFQRLYSCILQDGCSSTCQIEAGFECLGGTAALPFWPQHSWQLQSRSCTHKAGFVILVRSECKPICGDGYEAKIQHMGWKKRSHFQCQQIAWHLGDVQTHVRETIFRPCDSTSEDSRWLRRNLWDDWAGAWRRLRWWQSCSMGWLQPVLPGRMILL